MHDTLKFQATDELKATAAQIEDLQAKIATPGLGEAELRILNLQLQTVQQRQKTVQRYLDIREARLGWLQATGQLEDAAPAAAPARPAARRQVFGIALG